MLTNKGTSVPFSSLGFHMLPGLCRFTQVKEVEFLSAFDYTPTATFPVASTILSTHLDQAEEFVELVEGYEPEGEGSLRTLRIAKHEIVNKASTFISLLEEIAKATIKENWVVDKELVRTDFGFFIYDIGGKFELHVDGTNYVGMPQRKFTSIFYMHEPSEDYDGGDLVFPTIVDELDRPLVFSPEKFTQLVWPSNENYPHEVLEVTSGRRIIFGLFFDTL